MFHKTSRDAVWFGIVLVGLILWTPLAGAQAPTRQQTQKQTQQQIQEETRQQSQQLAWDQQAEQTFGSAVAWDVNS